MSTGFFGHCRAKTWTPPEVALPRLCVTALWAGGHMSRPEYAPFGVSAAWGVRHRVVCRPWCAPTGMCPDRDLSPRGVRHAGMCVGRDVRRYGASAG